MSKIVYTPTVSLVCERYTSLFRRPRGMFFSAEDRGEYASMVRNWPFNKASAVRHMAQAGLMEESDNECNFLCVL